MMYTLNILIPGLAVLLFMLLIGVVVVFYLLLLSHGIRTQGIVGFLLSLIPGTLLSGAGYLGHKCLFKTDTSDRQFNHTMIHDDEVHTDTPL